MHFEGHGGVDLNSGCNCFGRSLSTRTAAQWCCWSVDWSQVVDHDIVDLNSGGNSQWEVFDVNVGAGVLLESRQFAVENYG